MCDICCAQRQCYHALVKSSVEPIGCCPLSFEAEMRRREFIGLIGGAVSAWPPVVGAQQTAKMKRVAIVAAMTETRNEFYRAFFEALGVLGYAEGQNLL